MARVRDADDLFALELATLLGAELEIAGLLDSLTRQVADGQLRIGFRRHRAETDEHVKRLETSLRIVGADPAPSGSPALEGLRREHEAWLRGLAPGASSTLADLVVAGSAAHVELYEIGSYEALLAKAELLGEDDVAELLQASLEEEREMLDEGRHIAGRLARELIDSPARA